MNLAKVELSWFRLRQNIQTRLYLLLDKWYRDICLLGLTSLLFIWGHIATVPACRSGALTNVLQHRNAMPQTKDMAPHLVIVYRHGAHLLLCYLLMWNITLEYTATHFNVFGQTRLGHPSPTFHTHQQTLNFIISIWWLSVRISVESVTYPLSLETGTCGVRIHYAIPSPTGASP